MKHGKKRLMSLALGLSLLLTMSVGAADMGAPPGGSNPPPPPPGGGGPTTFTTGDAVTELESGDYTDETFPDSTGETEVALRVGPGVSATLTNPTVTKTGGDTTGDSASFYGINAGILAYSEDESTPAELTINGGTVNTDASGANGIFAYGDATISLKDVTVNTTAENGAGGIMVAGGGTLYAENCNVHTEGGSCAAIRSDRGSGKMVVDGGTYVATGEKGSGSPAIYCVADITVSNATLSAGTAQAICFEGRNPAHIYNCFLEGGYNATDDDENCNVMVYQSMSGDSAEGTTYCTMVGGVLKANNVSETGNAKMFYTTNTYSYISLSRVQMEYAPGMETFLLCACNTNYRGWGTAGANGSDCVLYCKDQAVEHDIIYDTWSYLGCFFTEGSVVNSAIYYREDNGDRGCDVSMDASSVWNVTGDSTIRDLYTGGATINAKIVGADGTVYQEAPEGSEFTVTVLGTYSEEDHSGYEFVPGVGTVADGEYTFDTDVDDLVNLDYTPTDLNGNVYETAAWNYEEAAALAAETPEEEPSAVEEASAEELVIAPAPEAETEAPAEAPAEAPVETAESAESTSHTLPIVLGVIAVVIVAAAIVVVVKKKKK